MVGCFHLSCVGGAGRSYVYFLGGKNTIVSDTLSSPVVGTDPLALLLSDLV